MNKCAVCGTQLEWLTSTFCNACWLRALAIAKEESTERLVFVPEGHNVHITEPGVPVLTKEEFDNWKVEFKEHVFCGSTALKVDESLYPHTCPRCGKPAYIGLGQVECSGGCE